MAINNPMKLLKTKIDKLTRTVTGGDLIEAHLDYDVTKATGTLEYKGPLISREVWGQITSFFKWAYDTSQSEAQVRLFVSTKNNAWKAWAFPQEGHTGLSTKEIQDDEFQKQRAALFEKDDEWVAWGTVHSHAAISAFQSSIDEDDEESQGGLHITIGDLDKNQYSLHARLYHKEDKFEPDMSLFWDIGNPFEGLKPEVLALLPSTSADRAARLQMCHPMPTEFPAQWKANYRRPAPMVVHKPSGGGFVDEYFLEWQRRNESSRGVGSGRATTMPYSELKAIESMYTMEAKEMEDLLDELASAPMADIIDVCLDFNLSPQALANIWFHNRESAQDTPTETGPEEKDNYPYGNGA
jgi:hypothetical protein